MKISGKSIELISYSGDNEELNELISNSPDVGNMSETRLYPPRTPTEIKFEIRINGKLAGEMKLNKVRWFNRKAEISMILLPDFQGKGFGASILKLMIDYAFNKMNLHRLEAEIIEYNEASIRLFEKFGFKKEGTLRESKFDSGKYWDIFRYGLLKREYLKNGE